MSRHWLTSNAASAMEKEHQSNLQIRILEENAVHARVVSELNVIISELRERLRSRENEILSLEDQLARRDKVMPP